MAKDNSKIPSNLNPHTISKAKLARMAYQAMTEDFYVNNTKNTVVFHIGPRGYAPVKGTPFSAGWDLFSPNQEESIILSPRKVSKISIDVRVSLPRGWHGEIKSRSSWALQGLFVEGGIIDEVCIDMILYIVL